MRCRRIKKLLVPFMDGELPDEQRKGVVEHLKRCSSCRRRLESLQKVEALTHQLAPTEPEEVYWSTFLPRLKAKMAREEEKPLGERIRETMGKPFTPPISWVKIAGAVAAAVLVFILGRAVIHHEARMGRVRALPKKLLTEQVRIAEEKTTPEERVEMESLAGSSRVTSEPQAPLGQEELVISKAMPPEKTTDLQEVPPQRPSELQSASDKEPPMVSEAAPRDRKAEPFTVSPPPQAESFEAADQVAQLEGQVPAGKTLEISVSGQADEGTPSRRSMAKAAKTTGADHWRQQIQTLQDNIKAHPRSDQLGQIHLRLAESWYRLAQMTARREDLLQAIEAHRAAMDFAAEETTRRSLRSRIQALEERLRKK